MWLCGLPGVGGRGRDQRTRCEVVFLGSLLRLQEPQPQRWFLSRAELPDAWASPADNSMECLELVKEKTGSPPS